MNNLQFDEEIKTSCGGESNIHLFLKHIIAENLKLIGFKVKLEKVTDDGRIDVFAEKNNNVLKIEIIKSHIPEWILIKVMGDIDKRIKKPQTNRKLFECKRCTWTWFPRSEYERTLLCPNCHSPKWDQEKK